jgi:glycosyltransferase involved in cell wall biosynthesis
MFKINLEGNWNPTSYGVVLKNFVKAVAKDFPNVDIALFPIDPQLQAENEEESRFAQQFINKPYDYTSPSLKIWHQNDLAKRIYSNNKSVGYSFFELDSLNEQEVDHIASLDVFCTASQWAADIAGEQLGQELQDVVVVPLGVDTDIFYPRTEQNKGEMFKFLNVGKWEVRKGHDILPDIMQKALPDEPYELYMLNHNPFLTVNEIQAWHSHYRQKLGNKVKFVEPSPTHEGVASLMNQCHCGVFPSRAEGWNLELLECMACGLNVVTTNYSAHTEYCNEDNAHLVTPSKKEKAMDGRWFFGDREWASLGGCIDDMVDQIREVYYTYDKDSVKQKRNNAIETSKKYSWSGTAAKLLKVLEL